MSDQHLVIGIIWAHVADLLGLAILVPLVIWAFIHVLKKSEDPSLLLFKWILTAIVIGAAIKLIVPIMRVPSFAAAFVGIPATCVVGLIMAGIWRKNLASMIATPFSNLYDGGTEPPVPKPAYSTALAQRKRGLYQEAAASVQKELDRFPTDFEGQILLADIQADDLHDLPTAMMTIERICNQPEHAPRNVALALNTVADWQLKYNRDRDAAREALQRIIQILPDTEMSVLAAQRIGSLSSGEHLLLQQERKKFEVVEGIQNLGLLDPRFHPKPADEDAAKQAAELVQHLQAHPLDGEARERLAVIYATHYNRLDLATDQYEQLITCPNQPQKRVVSWLHSLADLQIRNGANYETVRATVQRIIDLYPNSAVAGVAASRIAHLKLELKGQQQSAHSVKMGTYEQDIGLKTPGR
jgi:tetratricopeptide (TPR) repeat protein